MIALVVVSIIDSAAAHAKPTHAGSSPVAEACTILRWA
jgi:hypothetical protein